MKRLFLVVVTFMIVPLILAQPTTTTTTYFEVTLLSQSPDPVEPGTIVEVRFKVENYGVGTDEDVVVQLLPKYPFSLYDSPATKNLGAMRSRQIGSDAAIISYNLLVDSAAVEESAELELQILVGGEIRQTFTIDQFFVDIATRDAVLDISKVQLGNNGSLAPGNRGTLTITLNNHADSPVRNIHLNLDLSGQSLIPFQQSSEKRLAQLRGGFQASLMYEVMASPDAKTGVYTIPFELTYEDNRGDNYTKEDEISVIINGIPELQAYIRDSTITGKGQRGTITIELANSGVTDIKFLQITVLNSEDYEILSSTNTRYIGDVDSDDIETEDFELYMKKNGIVYIPLRVTYKDSTNVPFEHIIQVPLRVFTNRELSKYGIQSSAGGTFFLLLVLVGGGSYWWWKRRKKKLLLTEKKEKRRT